MALGSRSSDSQSQFHHYAAGAGAALVTAIFTIIAVSSYATLLFAGDNAALAPTGLNIGLYTAVVVGILVALFSSYRSAIAIPQDRIAPILAIMISSISAIMAEADAEKRILTILASIPLVTLITGVFLYGLGKLRLGNLIRYIPYPVIGGFLAGSGWLLALGAFKVTAGLTLNWANLPELLSADLRYQWLAAVVFGSVMFAMIKWRPHILLPLGMLLGAIVLFYLVLFFAGLTPDEARQGGWLQTLPVAGDVQYSILFQLQILGQADFSVFFRQFDLLAAILMTSVVSILLTASALEISAREEIDLNRELRVAGLANLVSGAGGGMVGFHSLSLSQLVINLGGRGRFIGLMSAGICAVAFFLGSFFIEFIPLFVCGGLLFFLGLSFLWEWLVEGFKRFNTLDYLVILLIVGVTSVAGYPAGVGTGILLATMLFIHNYSQVDIVTNAFRGGDVTSNVDRPITQVRELRRQGDSIYALMLQGYIFFGTANHLLDVVRRKQTELPEGTLRYVVLDFHHVTGIDSSAMMSLAKIRSLAVQKNLRVLLTHLNDAVARQLQRSGFFREEDPEDPVIQIFEDLDHGLEYCENKVLGLTSVDQLGEPCPLQEQFTTTQHTAEEARELLKFMERHEVAAGEVIIRQDDPPDRLYYLESGVVTVSLELKTGKMLRLRKMGAGTFIGEIGMYLQAPRTAYVIAATPCVLHSLSQEALDRLNQERPQLGASFHHFMVGVLAERLSNMGKIIKTLLD